MKRLAFILLSALLLNPLTAQTASSFENFAPIKNDETSLGISAVAESPTISVLVGNTWNKLPDNRLEAVSSVICKGPGAAPCKTTSKYSLTGTMVAPLCEGNKINCIGEVYGFLNGSKVLGEFLGYTSLAQVEADPKNALFNEGRSASRWKIPGVLNSGGTDTYMVTVSYGLRYQDGSYAFDKFDSRIEPYVEASRPGVKSMVAENSKEPDGKSWVNYMSSGCLWGLDGICGTAVDFNSGQRLGIKMRFQNDVSNWFQGRLSDPNISIAKFGSNAKTIDVSGEAINTPLLRATFKESEITPKLQSFMKKIEFVFSPGISTTANPDNPGVFEWIEGLRSFLKETAANSKSQWSMANLISDRSGCLSSKTEVLGIVTTNAMAYQPGPPTYKAGFLQYEVSGLHYEPDGVTTQLGTYDLVMRSSVARCLYGFSKAPLSGTVSVVNDKGAKTTATTVVGEKDGWIKLRAAGFTFSKKTIKVKITKKKK